MCGWEDIIAALSNKKREEELVFLKQQKYLDAVCVFLWASLPVLVPFATFTTTVLMGESLNAVQVFTTIALLNMLIFPMNALPWIVNGVMESRVSLKRIGRLLSAVDQDPQESGSTEIRRYLHLNTTRSEWSQDLYSGSVLNPSWTATLLPAHYCAAHARDVGHEGFVLGPLGADAFAVRPGQFVGVAGRVGSGKSSLLQAILKEMVPMTSVPLRKNQFENDGLVFSYCPQLPVIHSGTVFSNIVFGSTYNKSRYLEVIEGCGLKEDVRCLSTAIRRVRACVCV